MTDPNVTLPQVSIFPAWSETRPDLSVLVFAVVYAGRALDQCDALLIVLNKSGARSIRVFHDDPNEANACNRACMAAQSLAREALS